MIDVITLYSVRAEVVGPFVRSLGWGGDWYTLARALAPEMIASDLLQHETTGVAPLLSSSSVLFLCLDFWTSREAYQRACQSPACQALLLARRQMADCAFEFGAFSFPKQADTEILAMPAVVRN